MYQETFVLDENLSLIEASKIIAAGTHYQNCNACLMQVYEPICDPDRIMNRMRIQRETLPKASIVGMTTLGPIVPKMKVPSNPTITLMYFNNSDFDIYLFDCHEIDPSEIGKQLCEKLAETEHVQGVLLLTASATIVPTPVIEKLEDRFPDITIFGAQAGTQELGNDQSMVFTSHQLCDKGILAVVFHGEDLHIKTDYNLGWRAIGREMTITEVGEAGYVKTIDYESAATVYHRYLGVEPDQWFYANVCAFPLLTPSGKRLIARVPTNVADDGAMRFPAMIEEGSKVTLSYTKPEYLLRSSLASANEMATFAPQAIMLFACINRRVYMGNEYADREFDYYRMICPELSYGYGYGEILRTPEGGELLNSSIVAAGFREGDIPEGYCVEPLSVPELSETGMKFRTLADCLATFLEATTADLRQTIEDLEELASRDQLTGLYNRRWLDEEVEQRLGKHRRRNDQGFAVLMYDIDFFKDVNDTYGHETGDAVLRELSHRVRAIVRSEDVVGRWGGEEFIIIANSANLENATGLAERIRKAIAAEPFPAIGEVTISFGVTCVQDDDTPISLFARVDSALYEAKNSGRNCVVAR